MVDRIEFIAGPRELEALGKKWKGTISDISPLLEDKDSGEPADEKALKEAGLIDKEGEIAERVRPAIEVLAAVDAFTRIYLTDSPDAVFEHLCFFAPDGRSVSMTNDAGKYIISCPDITDDVIQGVWSRMGGSIYRGCAFSADLTENEALALASMMDLQRKAILHAIANEQKAGPAAIEKDKILPPFGKDGGSYQWLTNVFKRLIDVKKAAPEDGLQAALDGLIEKGMIRKDGRFITLSVDAQLLCRRMLVIDRILSVVTGKLEEKGPFSFVAFTCLQAGVSDILLLDNGSEAFHMETLSASTAIDYLTVFFHPKAMRNLHPRPDEEKGKEVN